MNNVLALILVALVALPVSAETVSLSGEFAEIEVTGSQRAIEALLDGDPQYIESVTGAPERYAPPVLYALSAALFTSGRKDEAMFWFYAGQLRARSDANKALDISARQAVGLLNNRFGRPINQYAFQDLDKLENTVEKVLAWDERTGRRYDPRWISLHGMDAFTKLQVAFEPKAKWVEIDGLTRTMYLEGFRAAMARVRGRD